MKALLIDLDGVVYEGDTAIPGAPECLTWLKAQRIPHLFLTNTTSRSRSALVAKLGDMGVEIDARNILTPPVVATAWLKQHVSGPAALFVPDATRSEFDSVAQAERGVEAVVIGDYGDRWSFAELNRAFRLLMNEPRPQLVALGMTRYWRAPDGLRLDTGAIVTALAHASGIEPVVLGKPAPQFFAEALAILDVTAHDAIMIGDDIQADIGGAQACGLEGILVCTGKFRPTDLETGIEPAAVLDSIAALPELWPNLAE